MPQARPGAAIPTGGAAYEWPSPTAPVCRQSHGCWPLSFSGAESFDPVLALAHRRNGGPQAVPASRTKAWIPSAPTLLVMAETSGRVTEGPSDLGLRRVLRFPQRDHRIRFRSPVLHAVVGEDDTVHGDHSLRSLGPERHPVIDIHRAAWWRRARQKFFLLRGHRWPSCQIRFSPRSGQV